MSTENNPEPTHVIESDQESMAADHTQAELLICYHHLGHLPFSNMRILAMIGVTTNNFDTVNPPKCVGCIYGAMTYQPW